MGLKCDCYAHEWKCEICEKNHFSESKYLVELSTRRLPQNAKRIRLRIANNEWNICKLDAAGIAQITYNATATCIVGGSCRDKLHQIHCAHTFQLLCTRVTRSQQGRRNNVYVDINVYSLQFPRSRSRLPEEGTASSQCKSICKYNVCT